MSDPTEKPSRTAFLYSPSHRYDTIRGHAQALGSVLVAALCVVGSRGFARAGTIVDMPSKVREIVADPVRPYVYAILDRPEVAVLDVQTGALSAPAIALPEVGVQMAVERDGSKLYVALKDSFAVAVIDPGARAVVNVIATSATREPGEMAVGRPGRLYVLFLWYLSVIDTAASAEIRVDDLVHSSDFTAFFAVTNSGETLFELEKSGPPHLVVFDVSVDRTLWLGGHCHFNCLGAWARGIHVSADDSKLYVVTEYPSHVQVLSTVSLPHEVNAVLTGFPSQAAALSPDGTTLYICSASSVVAAATADWLPWWSAPLAGWPALGGAVVSGDGTTLAVAFAPDKYIVPEQIELVDLTSLIPNRGGVRLRPLDDQTGLAIHGASVQPGVPGASTDYVDIQGGILGCAPLPAGTFDLELTAPGHDPVNLQGAVVAGVWSDLGDVVMHRTGAILAPSRFCASPALRPGTTTDIELHGTGFEPGLELVSDVAQLAINSFSVRNWAVIDANVTLTEGAPAGYWSYDLLVTNPDGQSDLGNFFVLPPASVNPPNPIPCLYATKSLPRDVVAIWDDSPVDALHDEAERYTLYRSTVLPASGFQALIAAANTVSPREEALDAGGIEWSPPCSHLHFYKVAAENAGGDSGDVP